MDHVDKGHTVPKMAKLLIILLSFYLMSACVGQVTQNSHCVQNINVVQNFDPVTYAGTWYDIESLDKRTGTCQVHSWTGQTTITIRNSVVEAGVLRSETGTASYTDIAKYTVTFNSGTGAPRTSNYWILDTDYTTFALVYSCEDIPTDAGVARRVNLWKLGRNTGPLPVAAQDRINTVIQRYPTLSSIDSNAFHERKHGAGDCSVSVVPGACPTVNVDSNFNIDAFLGEWNEISRLRDAAETGQCNNVEFQRDNIANVITVQNTEINNELMDTLSGTAPVSNTGILDITYGGNVENVQLHVLATDNANYALVYSCVTITGGETTRRVNSGILRKTNRALTDLENDKINNAITAIGFDRVHFQQTQQTDAACFYYPEYPDGLPGTIEFRGSCPTTITGDGNFNIQDFLGTWYEVARYPSLQTGQCNSVEYRNLGATGSFTVEYTEVLNEALITTLVNGRTTEQNGVLEVYLNIGGVPTPTNIHVLATDNHNYALVYSCRSFAVDGQNRRQVMSWKLSKFPRQLSTEHNEAINIVIEGTEGLRDNYYQYTHQTDAACFHYPEYPNGLPGSIEFRGSCPNTITGATNFNIQNFFSRTWYEVARYPSLQNGQCNSVEYRNLGATGSFTVEYTEVLNEALITTLVNGRTTEQNGVLEVDLNIGGELTPTRIHVLATDNENYALVYSCANFKDGNDLNRRRVMSWKLSINPSLSAEHNEAINIVIEGTEGLHENYYQYTHQTDEACFHYPEYPDGLPGTIEFRGSCPTTITGDGNFKIQDYLGTWYEVARYPQPTQTGQCSRAVYAAGDTAGVISVVNTEVNNEELTTISGHAILISTSGHLLVSLNVGSENRISDFQVLATDYANYALVYSCINIEVEGQNRRRVSSWKLSRTAEPLSDESNNVIDTVISNIQGLNNAYYQQTSQSDAACFINPEFDELPDSIELPGACPTITGVQNFNLNAYLGTWFEVARYPQPTQSGQCSRAVYAPGAIRGVVSVMHTEVSNQALFTVSGQATTTAESGVLEVTLNVGSENRISNLHILATDYDNYALVYNCINIEGNRRRVSSWILSRTTEPMSNEASAAINTVISATEGLNSNFYLYTSQSDASCFYYPVLKHLQSRT